MNLRVLLITIKNFIFKCLLIILTDKYSLTKKIEHGTGPVWQGSWAIFANFLSHRLTPDSSLWRSICIPYTICVKKATLCSLHSSGRISGLIRCWAGGGAGRRSSRMEGWKNRGNRSTLDITPVSQVAHTGTIHLKKMIKQ